MLQQYYNNAACCDSSACDNSACYNYDHNAIAVHAVIVMFTGERDYNVKGTVVWLHHCEMVN